MSVVAVVIAEEEAGFLRTKARLKCDGLEVVWQPAVMTPDWGEITSGGVSSCLLQFPGEVGCYLSHRLALSRARGAGYLFVFEEDVHVVDGWLALVLQAAERLSCVSPDWAYLRLGSSQWGRCRRQERAVHTVLPDNASTCGLFAVLYHDPQQVLCLLPEAPSDALDRYLLQHQEQFPGFSCVAPGLAVADVSSSSIRGGRDMVSHARRMGWDLYRFNTLTSGLDSLAFVFVVSAFRCRDWVERCLRSLSVQTYRNFRVEYVDDASDDGTAGLAEDLMVGLGLNGRVHRFGERQGQARGRYTVYSRAAADEVCFMLDGDDWLAHPDALRHVSLFMQQTGADMVYNSYCTYAGKGKITYPVPVEDYSPQEKAGRTHRACPWRARHPRVMRASLLQHVRPDAHLQFGGDGGWIRVCTDLAESFVCLDRARYPMRLDVPLPVYVYNQENSKRYETSYYNLGSCDSKVREERAETERWVRHGSGH